MHESIVFRSIRARCRRKESSRSLSHLLVSFLLNSALADLLCKYQIYVILLWTFFSTTIVYTDTYRFNRIVVDRIISPYGYDLIVSRVRMYRTYAIDEVSVSACSDVNHVRWIMQHNLNVSDVTLELSPEWSSTTSVVYQGVRCITYNIHQWRRQEHTIWKVADSGGSS